ncbi:MULTISPECIES: Rieske (2Fe-2S) protein [Arthrobacter]|uniref:Rieske (2Fe-2S) protein n=1 Tax=unclassified Arthrobacter TaxID=235627 RepID=UPI0024BA9269|nr:Rieske (2Fe-2S) protein [Arthrobacter sp. H35-MC1]MDJ0318094.1 Rieske (2Fe-2S) protein [Arthrobacter sp. H35-MC1]
MSIDPSLSRRAALLAGTAASGTACALALAGCAPSANNLRDKGKGPAEIPSTGTPYQVGKLSELPVGGTAAGTANDVEVMLFRSDETTVLAYTDICTHAGCKVSPDGENFKCPCHGTVFNGSDGTVQSGPAKEPLPRYAAAIDGEWITVSL